MAEDEITFAQVAQIETNSLDWPFGVHETVSETPQVFMFAARGVAFLLTDALHLGAKKMAVTIHAVMSESIHLRYRRLQKADHTGFLAISGPTSYNLRGASLRHRQSFADSEFPPVGEDPRRAAIDSDATPSGIEK